MKRLSTASLVAGALIVSASGAIAATPAGSGNAARYPAPIPAPPVINPGPAACGPELKPDVTCGSGFRTFLVCYVKNKLVSQTMQLCVPENSRSLLVPE